MVTSEKQTLTKADVGTMTMTAEVTDPTKRRVKAPVVDLVADAGKDRAEQLRLIDAQHARRLIKVFDAGYTLTGARLSHKKDDHENGVVVTFSEEEARPVLDAIRKVVEARTKT